MSRVNSRTHNPEDGVGKFLRNVGKQLPKHTAQRFRRRGLSIRKNGFVADKNFDFVSLVVGMALGVQHDLTYWQSLYYL